MEVTDTDEGTQGVSRRAMEQILRRARQARAAVREGGVRGLTVRTLDGIARRIDNPRVLASVPDSDVLAADLSAPWAAPYRSVTADEPLTINWVTSPPRQHSGGHTTTFRLIRYLQSRGHDMRVYFFDVYGADLEYYRRLLIENYADLPVGNVFDGMSDAHGVVATCWESAYPAFNARSAGKRFYLVQDFEPWFYPAGAPAALAENTYRMGFHAITAGPWLSSLLRRNYGMDADHFEFGCDTDIYQLGNDHRDSVVFYSRPDTPRRAFELGLLALELFAAAHPEVQIHAFGGLAAGNGGLRFPIVDHGLVPPVELNRLYNRSFAGLCLSMSNVSLVPHEMLAAGCIPVVNDADHNRIVLDNPHVQYASPDPHALARTLGSLIGPPDASRLATVSGSVHSASWDAAGAAVEAAFYRALAPSSSASIPSSG